MTLGDIIAAYRAEHNLSMEAFANLAGISKAYISMLERNRTQRGDEPVPSIDTFRKVADAMGLDVDALIRMVDGKISLAEATVPENIIPLPTMRKIPLVGTIACGTPTLAIENIEEEVDIPEQIHADFALRCKGDSMIGAEIYDGDIVYIRQQETVLNGQIAAVLIDDEATLKRFYYDESSGVVSLMAANSAIGPLIYQGETLNHIRVLGLAVGLTRRI